MSQYDVGSEAARIHECVVVELRNHTAEDRVRVIADGLLSAYHRGVSTRCEQPDGLARMAYEAFADAASPMLGAMPTWGTMPPDAREHWRAVANAIAQRIGGVAS